MSPTEKCLVYLFIDAISQSTIVEHKCEDLIVATNGK